MSSYEDQLTALGLPQEVVNRYLLANDVQAFRNRDSAAYGAPAALGGSAAAEGETT